MAATPDPSVPPSRHEPPPKLARWLASLWALWLAVVLINLVIDVLYAYIDPRIRLAR